MEFGIGELLITGGICWFIGLFLQRWIDKMDAMKICPHCGEELKIN